MTTYEIVIPLMGMNKEFLLPGETMTHVGRLDEVPDSAITLLRTPDFEYEREDRRTGQLFFPVDVLHPTWREDYKDRWCLVKEVRG